MAMNANREALQLIARRFKALSEPLRLQLLSLLRDGERNVSELIDGTGARQANISKHLAVLRRHGMIESRKDGLNVYYRIADPSIFEVCDLVSHSLEADLEMRRRALTSP